MAVTEPGVEAYVNLFNSQTGVGPNALIQGLPRYQNGETIGDFVRGLRHRILPIDLNVGKSALSSLSDAHDRRHRSRIQSCQQSAKKRRKQFMVHSLRATQLTRGVDATESGGSLTRQYIMDKIRKERMRLATSFKAITSIIIHHLNQKIIQQLVKQST